MAKAPVVAGPRRRWPRRLLIGLNVVLALSLVLTASVYGYLKYRFGQISKVDIPCEVLRRCDGRAEGPMNVLLVGSDSRKDISAEEQRKFGSERDVGGQRADTIIVLHVDDRQQKAAILSIPRDLAVPIAGSGSSRPQRINTAFERGPRTLIATIQESLRIPIDHYVEVDFNGFRGIVNALGGVKVYFPSPTRDRKSGHDVRTPGCVELDGEGALRYVRSREFEQYQSGRWRPDPTADLGRIQRQQDFIRRVLHKASRIGPNVVKLNRLVHTGVNNVSISRGLSEQDIFRLVRKFRSLSPDTVEMSSLPVTNARMGGAAVLQLDRRAADAVLAPFRDQGGQDQAPGDAPSGRPPVPPSSVRVRVLNGSGVDGQAGEVAQALQAARFNVAGTGDATSFRHSDSVIRYGPGQLAKAELLQRHVGGGAKLQEDRRLPGVDLVLTTGSSFTGIRSPSEAGAPPTGPPPTNKASAEPRGGPLQAEC